MGCPEDWPKIFGGYLLEFWRSRQGQISGETNEIKH